jgi:hypothetical protein
MLEITNKRKTAYILEILKLFGFVIMVTPVESAILNSEHGKRLKIISNLCTKDDKLKVIRKAIQKIENRC